MLLRTIVRGRAASILVHARPDSSHILTMRAYTQCLSPCSKACALGNSAVPRLKETYSFPTDYLLIIPDTRNVIIPSRFRRDERSLRDQQRAGDRRALAVVGHRKIAVNVRLICTVAGERCQDHTVAEPVLANFDRLEELWNYGCRHRRRRCWLTKGRAG